MGTNRRTLDGAYGEHDATLKTCALLVIILNDTGIRPDAFNVRFSVSN